MQLHRSDTPTRAVYAYRLYDEHSGTYHPIAYNDPCAYRRLSLCQGLVVGYESAKVRLSSVTSYQFLDDRMTPRPGLHAALAVHTRAEPARTCGHSGYRRAQCRPRSTLAVAVRRLRIRQAARHVVTRNLQARRHRRSYTGQRQQAHPRPVSRQRHRNRHRQLRHRQRFPHTGLRRGALSRVVGKARKMDADGRTALRL